MEGVISFTAEEGVVAGTAEEFVISFIPEQLIVPPQRRGRVIPSIADEYVVTRCSAVYFLAGPRVNPRCGQQDSRL